MILYDEYQETMSTRAKLEMAVLVAEMLRIEWRRLELADGRVWRRVCYDCCAIQPVTNTVNQPCVCGCNVVLWEPQL